MNFYLLIRLFLCEKNIKKSVIYTLYIRKKITVLHYLYIKVKKEIKL